MILIKEKKQFEQEVLRAEVRVMVDFYADWCGPCKMLTPLLEELDVSRKDYLIAKVNVDELPELAQQYRVASIPTLLIFKGGENIKRRVGLVSRQELEQLAEGCE